MSRFDDLWEDYLTDKMDEARLLEFLELMRQDPSMAVRIGELLNDQSYTGLGKRAQRDELFNRIMEKSGGKQQAPIKKLNWRRLAAAAVILLAVSLAAIFILQKDEPEKVVQQPVQNIQTNDIAPGGDRAILTLADGRQVILDTAGNGAVTKQGEITVIKMDGQLSYSPSAGVGESEVLYNTISTPRGGQYQLVLADGSKVWLNAASSLRFPTAFVGTERRVELTGEGYFEITKYEVRGTELPFLVNANGVVTEVLGTQFNINAYDDEPSTKVTLLEGAVKVSNTGGSALLKPSQQATITKDQKPETRNKIDVDDAIAWKEGYFSFDHSDMNEILREISRWYDITVEVKGVIGPDKEFFGRVTRNRSLASAIKVLKEGGPSNINYTIVGNKLIVQPVRKN